jgi:GDP-mannose 4,6-dehydratase
MRFLITGITGFAGPHLSNLLIEHGHEVHGLVRHTNARENDIRDVVPDSNLNKIIFHYSDLNNFRGLKSIFESFKFDGVFHLAAQSHPPTSFADPLATFHDNISGSANLIQVITEIQPECKFMFCSTSEVYGNIGISGEKIHWTEKLQPSNPYGVSKAAIDLYVQERIQNNFLKGFITRAFSHTGPRRGMNFSISSDAFQIARMKLGMQNRILKVGNLESVRVVIDVRDTVNSYYLAMINNNSNGEIFNVCGSNPYPMEFFTNKLIELSGLSNVTKEVSSDLYRPIDIHYQHGDSDNLQKLTGWEPIIPIEKTLEDLLEYWLKKLKN